MPILIKRFIMNIKYTRVPVSQKLRVPTIQLFVQVLFIKNIY